MSTTPRSPKLLKGAIVSVPALVPVPTVVLFQYNPESLTRSIEPQIEGGTKENRTEAARFVGAPIENISMELDIDAIDQLERGSFMANQKGILPQLAALEILAYPQSAQVIAQAVMLAAGTIEVLPTPAPFTLLVYGSSRVLPVRLMSYSANEIDHDVNLNPIRAKVSLQLRVLTYSDLQLTDPGYHLFLSHQITKEVMALTMSASNVASSIGVDTSKFI
jgi:hypothetical protein